METPERIAAASIFAGPPETGTGPFGVARSPVRADAGDPEDE